MSRDANGNYTLPTGNPVITGNTIDSSWANDTMSDLGNEITNSLDRFGKGGMAAPLRLINGSKTIPSMSFTNETNSGFYRDGVGDIRLSIRNKDALKILEDAKIEVLQGVYTFNGEGLFQETNRLYVGVDATAPEVFTEANVTTFAQGFLDDANATAARTTLGLGTAATRDVTTSETDATAGRVLKVGDFGLGSVSPTTFLNANLAVINGFYAAGGTDAINYPPGLSRFGILRVETRGTTQVTQEVTFDNTIHTRYSSDAGSTWTNWVEIATEQNNSLITSGSNSNGSFTRFPDGTQICYTRFDYTFPNSIAPNTQGSANFPYPAAFVGVGVSKTMNGYVTDNGGNISNISLVPRVSNAWFFSFYNESFPSTFTITRILNLELIAIGRWK